MDNPSHRTNSRCSMTGNMLARTGNCPAGASPYTIGCRWRNRPAKAIASPTSNGTVSHGQAFMVAVRTRNSLVNTPNGGKPAMATVPINRPQPTAGWVRIRPRICWIDWVPAICAACPTVTNTALLVSECTVMCSNAAKVASGPPMPKAKVMSPMCSIEE